MHGILKFAHTGNFSKSSHYDPDFHRHRPALSPQIHIIFLVQHLTEYPFSLHMHKNLKNES